MALEATPGFMQDLAYPAEVTRRSIFFMLARNGSGSVGSVGGGIVGATDLLTSAPSSGMSVNNATGEAIVPGTSSTTQSGYYVRGASQTNTSVAAANGTNPRIDIVCATMNDTFYGASGTSSAFIQVVTGTPTAGATLGNLSGAPALPGSSLLLAYLLVPAGVTSIVSGDLADERVNVTLGVGAGLTLSGGQLISVSGTTISVNAKESVNVVSTSGSTVTLANPATDIGNDITLSANCTITMPTASQGLVCWAFIHQGASAYTVTWPAAGSSAGNVNWPGGTAPFMTATASAVDLYEFVGTAGGYWRATAIQNFAH